jgi:hypothetical protein
MTCGLSHTSVSCIYVVINLYKQIGGDDGIQQGMVRDKQGFCHRITCGEGYIYVMICRFRIE